MAANIVQFLPARVHVITMPYLATYWGLLVSVTFTASVCMVQYSNPSSNLYIHANMQGWLLRKHRKDTLDLHVRQGQQCRKNIHTYCCGAYHFPEDYNLLRDRIENTGCKRNLNQGGCPTTGPLLRH